MGKRKILTILIIYLFAGVAGFLLVPENSMAKKALPKKITVAKKKATVTEGKKHKIAYKVKGNKKANKKVVFSSSNKSIATVSKKGVVKAKKAGSVTITLRAKAKKSVKAKVKITVAEKAPIIGGSALSLLSPTKVIRKAANNTIAPTALIMRETLELEPGEKYQMDVSMMPATATGTITWSCNYMGGINVYPNGSIYVTDDTPPGTTAKITATCGKVSASCTLTIKYGGGCDHSQYWNAGTVTTPVTCMKDGVKTYTCTNCGKTKTEAIPATGHKWKEGNLLEEPTCTAIGKREHICENCGSTKEEIVPVNAHVWVDGEIIKEPTCTGRGQKKYSCANCDAEKTEAMPANGHTWDNGETTKEPTCTATGTTTYHCTVDGCKGIKTDKIVANGHTYNYGIVEKEATCTEDGVRVSECLVCTKKMTVRLTKLGHDMDDGTETVKPTCITGGKIEYKCKHAGCDYINIVSTKSNGHKWVQEPVLDENGNPVPETDKNGNTVIGDDGKPVMKTRDKFFVDKPQTCTEQGEKSKHCENCDKRSSVTAIKADGHNLDKGTITKEQTCLKAGAIEYKCQTAGCSYVKKGALAPLGHKWETEQVLDAAGNPVTKEKYTRDVEPECRKTGEESIHCIREVGTEKCTARKNIRSVKANGHDYDETVKKPATCSEDGILHFDCKNCDYWKEEPITAVGHKYSDSYTTDLTPTCTTPGSETKHCDVCGVKSDEKVIPATGHTWGAWSQVKAATCTEGGLRERSCTNGCNMKEQEGIVATGHVRNASGSCNKCGDSVTYEETTSADWNFALDTVNRVITLRYYKGGKEYITIPRTMDIVEGGVTTTYIVAFKECEGRETTGIFTSNVKGCDVKGVRFAADMDIESLAYMFYNCKALEEVADIPSTVKDLYGTFKGCEKLVSVVGGLPSGITELKNTFENCSSLQAAPEIPDTVTSLYATFKNAVSLTAAPKIPSGVTDMNWTFSGCKSLLMPPELPAALTGMTNTFGDCTALQEVPALIPSGVSRMTMTYYGCTTLKLAPALPETVKTLEYTYKNCTGLTYAAPLLRGVEQIGAFDGCSLLEGTK